MKTKQIQLSKTLISGIMLIVLMSMASCNNKQANTENSEEQSTIIEAPGLDLMSATFMGDIKAIKQHIEAGSNLNEKEPIMGSSALITAAVFNRIEIARVLIDAGADVNLTNNEGSTALHSASFLCRTEIVKMLLENNAEKNIRNIYGSTALESVTAPFESVKLIYDQFSKDLGPMGFKLDYEQVEETRPVIADMLK